MKIISLTEEEGFKKGFKGKQGKPLVNKKEIFSGVRAALERQEADRDRREGRQQKVKGLRRAWGTGEGGRRNENRKAGEGK